MSISFGAVPRNTEAIATTQSFILEKICPPPQDSAILTCQKSSLSFSSWNRWLRIWEKWALRNVFASSFLLNAFFQWQYSLICRIPRVWSASHLPTSSLFPRYLTLSPFSTAYIILQFSNDWCCGSSKKCPLKESCVRRLAWDELDVRSDWVLQALT